jgi:GTP-binding protein HflX
MTGRRSSTAVVAKRRTAPPIETEEIRALCEAAGVEVVAERTQARPRDPTYDLGDGAVADVADLVERHAADLVVVDDHLDPGSAYELEETVGGEVVDRPRLVLDIFADRAETKRARLEVRLAELRYELPRAQAKAERGESQGRRGFKSGGEEPQAAQLRADYKQRIKHRREELDQLDDADDGVREARRESGFDLVALAGYTNAGKSTLLRRLADDLVVDENDGHGDLTDTAASRDRLFETLNTTTRRATVGDRRVLLTDTVGFVDDLPGWLVSSFRTTLAAAREADAVLLVVDATDDPGEIRSKVETSLDELEDADGTLVPVLNKRDEATALDAKRGLLADLANERPVVTSATEDVGLDDLRKRLLDVLPDRECVSLSVPNTDDGNAFVSWCHDHGTVHDLEYGDRIAFDFEARSEVAAKAEGRAEKLGGD